MFDSTTTRFILPTFASLLPSPGSLTLTDVRQRAVELFFDGMCVPAFKPMLPAVIQRPTNEFIALVFDVAKEIKLVRVKLAREDAMGYLIADLLGVELLPEEALRLGESVRKAAIAAKDGDLALKNGASAQKSKLRKKAEKDSVRAARLEAELLAVDAKAELARASLRRMPITLAGLPNQNSELVRRRAPKPGMRALTYLAMYCNSTHSNSFQLTINTQMSQRHYTHVQTPLVRRYARVGAHCWR